MVVVEPRGPFWYVVVTKVIKTGMISVFCWWCTLTVTAAVAAAAVDFTLFFSCVCLWTVPSCCNMQHYTPISQLIFRRCVRWRVSACVCVCTLQASVHALLFQFVRFRFSLSLSLSLPLLLLHFFRPTSTFLPFFLWLCLCCVMKPLPVLVSSRGCMNSLSPKYTHYLSLSLSLFIYTHTLPLSLWLKKSEREFLKVYTHIHRESAAACLASCHVYCMVSLPKGGLCNEAKGPSRTFQIESLF